MNKILLLFAVSLIGNTIEAQEWIPENNNNPANFKHIVNAYRSAHPVNAERPTVQPGEEDENYQFDRWAWYWQQHLDANGNMVSPVKTLKEWQAYTNKQNSLGKLSRTTKDSTYWKEPWTFIGPTTPYNYVFGIGRVNMVAFHPTDTNTYWIGTATGGAWKTTDNGITWTSMTDNLPNLAISDIKINPLNPSTIYLCTGDGDGKNLYSIGVLKSVDEGRTWNITGISWSVSSLMLANSLLINPIDTNSLILAASDGIHRSYDGGNTWTIVQPGNFKQLVYHPTDTNIVFATSYNTGVSAQIYRSKDGGNTWTQVTSLANALRICLAVTPANTSVVKAVASSASSATHYGLDGIYASNDTGKTFRIIYGDSSCTRNLLADDDFGRTCHGQGQYDLCIAISPQDTGKVYVGGINSWYSTNGGYYFSLMTQYDGSAPAVAAIHPDKHFLGFNPKKPERLFECNDGGIYFSDNPGSLLWTNISKGVDVTQFYRLAVDKGADYILGGAQDNNAFQMYELGSYSPKAQGDGGECQIDYTDSTIYYVATQNGYIFRFGGPLGYEFISSTIPYYGAFITPYLIHPTDHSKIIAGYSSVFLSDDMGHTWNNIGPSSLPNYISRLGMTAADTSTIYAVEQGTETIHYTYNTGSTWNTMTAPYSGSIISDIQIDPKNKNNFWVTFGGYTTPKVAMYTGATSTWNAIDTNLPNVPINCIKIDTASGDMYIGTDVGVFVHQDTASKWLYYNTGMPNVIVNDLSINYKTGMLYAATYGRGIWKSVLRTGNPDSVGHTSTGIATVPFVMNALMLYPNPSRGSFTLSASSIYADKQITIRLTDITGKTVWSNTDTFDGNGHVQINTQGIAKGDYYLEAKSPSGIIGRTKVVIF